MPLAIFSKSPLAPQGTVVIEIGNDVYLFDDSKSVVVTNSTKAAALAANPYVTLVETLSAGGGGSSFGPAVYPVSDTPEAHGAKRDGVTDDSAAITAAIAAVITAGQANGTNCGTVWFSPGVYLISSAPNTAHTGRAQIPVPPVVSTGQKFTLSLRSMTNASAFPHWQQTSLQKAGTLILSNLNASYSGSLGSASVIGGPTTEQLGSTDGGFSNMLIEMDGISIATNYTNPLCVAVDLQCIAEMDIGTMSLSGNVVPPSTSTVPTAGGVGLRCPVTGNNDNLRIGSLSVQGFTEALIPGEHLVADRVGIIYSQIGVSMRIASDTVRINSLSVEDCQYHISTRNAAAAGGHKALIDVGTMDSEDGNAGLATSFHFDDAQNLLAGTANWQSSAPVVGGTALINGATHYTINQR